MAPNHSREPTQCRDPFPQVPYLILPGAKTRNLLSPADRKVSDMPQIHGKKFMGSSDGWLVYIDEVMELHILNPFAGATASLPSITTLSPIKGVVRHPLDGRITATGSRPTGYSRANSLQVNYLWSSYATTTSQIKELHFGLNPLCYAYVDNAIFHKGLLFTVCASGVVFTLA